MILVILIYHLKSVVIVSVTIVIISFVRTVSVIVLVKLVVGASKKKKYVLKI